MNHDINLSLKIKMNNNINKELFSLKELHKKNFYFKTIETDSLVKNNNE